MKLKQRIRFVMLLFAAIVLNCLLPVVVFWISDTIDEEKIAAVAIQQVDLNYQSDLDLSARLSIVNSSSRVYAMPVANGLTQSEQEIKSITNQFLQKLAGWQVTNDDLYDVRPMLFQYAGEGSIRLWIVNLSMIGGGYFQARVDDLSGVILNCRLSFPQEQWDSFMQESENTAGIAGIISEALRVQFSDRLHSDYRIEIETTADTDRFILSLIQSEGGNAEYRIPLEILDSDQLISIN